MSERMIFMGALGLLAECAVYLPGYEGEELRENIERCLDDAIEAGLPIKWRRILNRIEVEVV